MELAGVGVRGGIAYGEEGDGGAAGQLRQRKCQLLRVKHAHIGAAQAQVRRLEHDLGGGDGGVDFAVVFPVDTRAHPGGGRVVAHHQHHWGTEVHGGAAVYPGQGIRALAHQEILGLVIMGRGSGLGRLQQQAQLLLLDGPGVKLPQGIAGPCQFVKIHISHLSRALRRRGWSRPAAAGAASPRPFPCVRRK